MDRKAKEILFKTYWNSKGWTSDENQKTDPSDFEYAKEKGVMFEPLKISKTELITRLGKIVRAIPLKKVTDSFLSSLTNMRPDWRSGLGSYANAKRLLAQKNISDFNSGHGDHEDLNVLNFERIKWGGVRHFNGLYNCLDLELLNNEEVTLPNEQDTAIFRNILKAIDNSQFDDTAAKLRDNLKEVFKVSKDERHVLMEILSSAEIMKPLNHDRKEPGKHDWHFALHWRGKINTTAIM